MKWAINGENSLLKPILNIETEEQWNDDEEWR